MNNKDVKVYGVTANSEPAGGGGHSGGWRDGILTINVDGVSFTPAEYKIYVLLKEIKLKLGVVGGGGCGGAGATGGYSEVIINLPDDFTFYDAEMVKAENARLKELNRLMVGMLKDVLYCELPGSVSVTIREVLAKAGG